MCSALSPVAKILIFISFVDLLDSLEQTRLQRFGLDLDMSFM